MNESNFNKDLEKIMNLSNEELQKIFSQLSLSQVEELLVKLNEVK